MSEILQKIEEGLAKEGIPYSIRSGHKYVDSDDICTEIEIEFILFPECKNTDDLSLVYSKIARVLESVGIDPYESTQVIETSNKWIISL